MKRYLLSFILFTCWLAACSRAEEDTATPTIAPTATMVAPTNTPLPQPTATSTPLPSVTPVLATVTVMDQSLTEDGRLTITDVTSTSPSWLVVYTWDNDRRGEMLGYTAVSPGNNRNVTVTINPLAATAELIVQLYQDAGQLGELELSGPDVAVMVDDTAVSRRFAIERELTLPVIGVNNQVLTDTYVVEVAVIESPAPGWVLVQADDKGSPAGVVGFTFIEPGVNRNINIPINYLLATPRLHATLHQDNGRLHLFEPDEDVPWLQEGEPVTAVLTATLPQDIYILDQPMIGGMIEIERVIIPQAGWAVIYNDEEGEPGFIIGSAFLEAGLNENVLVEVTETAVTPQLYIRLHDDAEPLAEFNPGSDLLLTTADGRVPPATLFSTTPGNYLVTYDQPPSPTVHVPLVVVAADAWAVVYTDNVEEDESVVIGSSWLAAGVNRDVMIDINLELDVTELYVVLHQDLDAVATFDFPDGEDLPIRRSGEVIQLPFQLLLNS